MGHMNVWIVNQFANTPADPGGTRQYELARALVRSGHRVTVLASDFNLAKRSHKHTKPLRPWIQTDQDGIDWWWIYATPYRTNDWRRYANQAIFALTLALASMRLPAPDVVVGSSPQLPAAYVAHWIARMRHAAFVFEVRDLWPQVLIDMSGMTENQPLIRVLRIIERTLYRRSQRTIVLARGAREYVERRGANPNRVVWLPNSVDIQAFSGTTYEPETRSAWDLDDEAFLLLYAGAHGHANALSSVIAAARMLHEASRAPNVQIALVGDGPTKADVRCQIRDLPNVSLHDPVDKRNIPALLAMADAGIIPLADVALFRYGVSPNKLYDYYAAGLPVVAAVGGDVNAEVEERGVGVTAPPEDPAALADAIERLASVSATVRAGMSSRARQLAEERYDRRIVAERFERLLVDTVEEEKRA